MLTGYQARGDEMRHVLIVEDDELMRNKLAELLGEIQDLQIDMAADANSARKLMGGQRYQIAIVDIELGPGVKDRFAGMAITSELRDQGCIPLIVSGTGDDTLKGVTATMWGYDFVSKPINEVDLLNKVEQALAWESEHPRGEKSKAWPDGLTQAPNEPLKMLWKGKPLGLTMTQIQLLQKLANEPGTVISNTTLKKFMRSGNSPSALSTHFSNIRKKFREVDKDFKHIINEGQGYIWK